MNDLREANLEQECKIPPKNDKLPPMVYSDFNYRWPSIKARQKIVIAKPQKTIFHLDKSISATEARLEESQVYIVEVKDTLGEIATRKLGTKLQTLIDLNPQITGLDLLRVGEEIRLPKPRPLRDNAKTEVILRESGKKNAVQLSYNEIRLETGKELQLITALGRPMNFCYKGHPMPLNLAGSSPYTPKGREYNNPSRWFVTEDYTAPVPFLKGNTSFQNLLDTPAEEEIAIIPCENDEDKELAAMIVADTMAQDSAEGWNDIFLTQARSWLAGLAVEKTEMIGKELLSVRIQRNSDNKYYVIFKRYRGAREIFKGMRYSLKNLPKYAAKGVWTQIKQTNINTRNKGTDIDIGEGITLFSELKEYFTKPEDQRDLSDALVEVITDSDTGAFATVLGTNTAQLITATVFLLSGAVISSGIGLVVGNAQLVTLIGTGLDSVDNRLAQDMEQNVDDNSRIYDGKLPKYRRA